MVISPAGGANVNCYLKIDSIWGMNFRERAHRARGHHGGLFDNLWEGFDDISESFSVFGDFERSVFGDIPIDSHFHRNPASMYQQRFNQGINPYYRLSELLTFHNYRSKFSTNSTSPLSCVHFEVLFILVHVRLRLVQSSNHSRFKKEGIHFEGKWEMLFFWVWYRSAYKLKTWHIHTEPYPA